MTDLELTRLCAEAMGRDVKLREGKYYGVTLVCYDPLHDDAQAMALVKKFGLSCWWYLSVDGRKAEWWRVDAAPPHDCTARNADLNRAICETVAKMELARKP